MDTTKKQLNVLSICTGYGGLESGIQRTLGNCRTIAYVEIEAFAIINLVDKIEAGKMDAAPIWSDIKTFRSRLFRGYVDIITAGYPCQPFSAAGKRRGEKDPRHLWPYIRKTINDCRPGLVFLENVENHINIGIEKVLSDLERLGFRVAVGIFSAVEVGAPHQRKRVFILGYFESNDKRRFSIPTMYRKWIEAGRSGFNVADCAGVRSETGNSVEGAQGEGKPNIINDCSNVSDSERKGLQGTGFEKQEWRCKPFSFPGNWNSQPWPARPGQPQFDWEEPRTIPDPIGGDIETRS